MDVKSAIIGFLLAVVIFMMFKPTYSFYTSPDFLSGDLAVATELYKKTLEDASQEYKTKIDAIKDDESAKMRAVTEMSNFIEELGNKYNNFMIQNAPST
jgi:hypothetical protein